MSLPRLVSIQSEANSSITSRINELQDLKKYAESKIQNKDSKSDLIKLIEKFIEIETQSAIVEKYSSFNIMTNSIHDLSINLNKNIDSLNEFITVNKNTLETTNFLEYQKL